MTKLLLFAALITTIGLAMKRPASSIISKQPKRLNASSEQAEEDHVLKLIPRELLSSIGAQLVAEYPLRPLLSIIVNPTNKYVWISRSNPLGYLFCVSKAWNEAMNSNPFKTAFLHTPNRAHHLLISAEDSNKFAIEFPEVFQIGASLLNEDERIRLILEFDHLPALLHLSRLPNYEALTSEDYIRYMKRVLGNTPIVEEPDHFINYDFDQMVDFLSIVSHTQLEKSYEETFIFNIPQSTIVKIFIFEDLFDPQRFTWIFKMVRSGVLHIIRTRPDLAPTLKNWLVNLVPFVLPYVKRPCLSDVFLWAMVLAWLCDEEEILDLIDIEGLIANFIVTEDNEYFLDMLKKLSDRTTEGKEISSTQTNHFFNSFLGCNNTDHLGFDPHKLLAVFQNEILPRLDNSFAVQSTHQLLFDLTHQINELAAQNR